MAFSTSTRGGRSRAARCRDRPRAPLLRALCLAFLWACGEAPAPDPPGPLRLERVGAEPRPAAQAESRLVARLAPPPDIAPWRVEANRTEWFELEGEPGKFLLVSSREAVAVKIPTRPAGAYNRVLARLVAKTRVEVVAELERDGRVVARSVPHEFRGDGMPREIALDLPQATFLEAPADTLSLRFRRGDGPIGIVEIDLVWRPFEDWFGGEVDEPLLRGPGEELRPAVPLARGRTLRSRCVPPPGARLEVAAAPLPGFVTAAQRPVVEVALRSDGRTTRESLALEVGRGQRGGWSATTFDLADLAGREIEITFTLSVQGETSAWALVATPRLRVPRPAPPTVLLVTTDTHRADHVSAAPRGVPGLTPRLDALAARGLLFERCFSTTNVTVPSHAAILTGVHPRDTGLFLNADRLDDRAPTLAERFAEAGWRTFAAVSAHHLGERAGLTQGFERYDRPLGIERPAGRTVGRALSWLPAAEGEALFLWVHVYDAHAPYAPPPAFLPTPEDDSVGPIRRAYRGEVAYLDHELGRLFAQPRLRDGVIAVTADHGEVLKTHGIGFDHTALYSDTVHVPALLAWPGGPRGERTARPVDHLGLGRTLLELAGLEDARFPGRSWLADDDGSERTPRFAISAGAKSASITLAPWHLQLHLVERRRGTGWHREAHQVELFDLDRDPNCLHDLVEEEPDRARELRARLLTWLREARPLGWSRPAELDAASRAQLVQLGYAGESGAEIVQVDPRCDCRWCVRFGGGR